MQCIVLIVSNTAHYESLSLYIGLATIAYATNQSLTLMLSVTLIRLHKFSIKEDITGFVIH